MKPSFNLATRSAVTGLLLTTVWCRAESFVKNPEDLERIQKALPQQALAHPAQPRHLLIFTLNVGYGGHPSMAYANDAFALMGRKTGAFETTVSQDPRVFEPESLSRFDAVFFNNTVGNCFTNKDLRRNLAEFVAGGGGLLGVHGSTVAFTQWPGAIEDWPEFGHMIGARGANHKDSDEHVWMKLDDPENPVTRIFAGKGFDYREEFFRVHGPYSRSRVRVLLSIDTAKTDVNAGQPRGDCFRADNDYAVAWLRSYGRGRTFYCTMAHNPYVFWEPKLLQFYLGALQFALGDLPVPTTPSANLTPAGRAEEKLGWQLALQTSPNSDLLAEAPRLGLTTLVASLDQPISKSISHPFGPALDDEQRSEIRINLDEAGLRLKACALNTMPAAENDCRELFQFARRMGLDMFICDADPSSLGMLEKLCEEYRTSVALRDSAAGKPGRYSAPENALGLLRGRSPRLGVALTSQIWISDGMPSMTIRKLGERVFAIQIDKPSEAASVLPEVARLGLSPVICVNPDAEAAKACVEAIHETSLKLAD